MAIAGTGSTDLSELFARGEQIEAIARRFGLDFFAQEFTVIPSRKMLELMSYPLPAHFAHWSFGKAFERQKTMYDHGFGIPYELVLNADPAIAFLMENNPPPVQLLVMAHVYGHNDFFKHNAQFAHTRRDMLHSVAAAARRVREYEREHGTREVERFLDAALALQHHVDPDVYIKRETHDEQLARLRARQERPDVYADLFAAPELPPPLDEGRLPLEPERDLVGFIAEHAPLADWQRDVLTVVREEALYFVPQMRTKIMNEGWATFWHLRIMRELDLTPDEHLTFARYHGMVVATSPRQLNPYAVGLAMWEDIERRFDEPTDDERETFGRPGGEGRQKLFDVRETDSDASFLRQFLTDDLIDELDLYLYKAERGKLVVVEDDPAVIRRMLVEQHTSFGIPYIDVVDADHRGNRELLLVHRYEGAELDREHTEKTLEHVHHLWGRTVHLETVIDRKPAILSYDGDAHARRSGGSEPPAETLDL